MMKFVTKIILLFSSILVSQVPLLETGFETDPFTEGWIQDTAGAGWIRQNGTENSFAVNTGFYGMSHLDDEGSQDDWLITPVFSIPEYNSVMVTYWESGLFIEYMTSHEVCVSTDNGATWTRVSTTVPIDQEFNKVECPLTGFMGMDIRIGWHYTGNYSDQWFIDDVRIVYDNQPPVISKIEAESSIFPVIGTYVNNDMNIELDLYDRSDITVVKGYYSFDGGSSFSEIDFQITGSRFIWEGIVPAKAELSSGIIRFYLEDEYSNSQTTKDYVIKFIYDDLDPEIVDVRGTLVLVGNNADIAVTFKDFSKIVSCKGHYSKDNFVSQYDFDLSPGKINFFTYDGVIPAENEVINDGKLKFTIEDVEGNILLSDNYAIKWINSYSDLTKFDLRTSLSKNYVSPVKLQYRGTCWLFSTCAALESNLLMTSSWETSGEEGFPDLSESHMSWWMGFNKFFNGDIDPPDGSGLDVHMLSSYYIAAAYLTRGEGAVRESDSYFFTYVPERFSEYYHYYYARDIEWYSMDMELNGIETIKQKVIEYGSVGIGLLHTSYDPETFIHYQSPESPLYLSHGVNILGWDDDKITQAPEGPGAWLCKNSWGTDFGFDGFYWVSYYDKHAGKGNEGGAISFHNVERMKYDVVYYHDYHGYSAVLPGINEAFNAYTLKYGDNGCLSAVNIFNAVNDVDYTVKVYKNFVAGELLNEVSSISGHFEYRGYHTIDLTDAVLLNEGDQFYIYLYLSDGGQPIDQNFYIQTAYLTYESSASPGESYYFENGVWKDLYFNETIRYPRTANFCIKGLVIKDTVGIEGNIPRSNMLYQNYPNPFNPATVISYSIMSISDVELNIYNINGQLVKNLVNQKHEPGKYSVDFNADDLASGILFYELKINGVSALTRKMIIMK